MSKYWPPQGPGRRHKMEPIKHKPIEFVDDKFYLNLQPIQGMMPGSKEEYWIALWLYKMGVDFIYQHSVLGGRTRPGGQVIDFWITSTYLPTPLYFNGEGFHNKASEASDEYKLATLKKRMAGRIREPAIIWGKDVPTYWSVYPALRKVL